MNLTERFKAWLVENGLATKEATDDEFKAAATKAITDGKLPAKEFAELTAETTDDNTLGKQLVEGMKAIADGQTALLTAIKETKTAEKPDPVTTDDMKRSDADWVKEIDQASDKAAQDAVLDRMKEAKQKAKVNGKDLPDPKAITGPTVKQAHERYGTERKMAVYGEKHMFANMPVTDCGRPLYHPSDLDKAVCGAYYKLAFFKNGGSRYLDQASKKLQLTDHDRNLLEHAKNELQWTGIIGGEPQYAGTDNGGIAVDRRILTDGEKAILDDTTSGGLEVAPIVFDDALILTPLLSGELAPLVNMIPTARGRRIEGASMGNPTLTWGTAEGTQIGLFVTAGFIAAFDTNIFTLTGALEIGQDFESDSPLSVGQNVINVYGNRFQRELDDVISIGNGTTQPQGVRFAAGTTAVAGGGVAPTVAVYEAFLFGVGIEFQPVSEASRTVYCGSLTSYGRVRGIAVGTADQRRVFGMDHGNRMIFDHPYKINNTMADTIVWFANLAHYRMYRRMGMTVRVETGGKELARANLALIVVRGRFGGQLELGGYAAVSTTMQP
jgi:HK97 family phage major capsid protein